MFVWAISFDRVMFINSRSSHALNILKHLHKIKADQEKTDALINWLKNEHDIEQFVGNDWLLNYWCLLTECKVREREFFDKFPFIQST